MTTGADWLETARRVVDTFLAPPPASAPATEPEAPAADATGHAATCRWCPVCQAMAVARGERPEVSAALADLLTTTAEALRTLAESVPVSGHEAAAANGHGDGHEATDGDAGTDRPAGAATAAGEPEEEPEPTSTVQRIEIA